MVSVMSRLPLRFRVSKTADVEAKHRRLTGLALAVEQSPQQQSYLTGN